MSECLLAAVIDSAFGPLRGRDVFYYDGRLHCLLGSPLLGEVDSKEDDQEAECGGGDRDVEGGHTVAALAICLVA